MNGKQVRFKDVVSIETQLCHAIEDCDVKAIKKYIEHGADVNARTKNGITPMHWACGLGDDKVNLAIVEILLTNSGNPNVKSAEGLTPVHIAASWGFLPTLKLLISFGGNPWIEDNEGLNAWDVALQKNQWPILKYLTSYMEDDQADPSEDSIQCVFVKNREVDTASLSSSTLSCNNMGFLGSESTLSTSCTILNQAICNPTDSSVSSTGSSVIVEEYIYSDAEKGVDLIEWHYPPAINRESEADATLNEALCTFSNSVANSDSSMDSQMLIDELRSLGTSPGPITATTKQIYLRQLYRLRSERGVSTPSPQKLGISKELKNLIQNYPGLESDTKIASNLDRLLVTHFTCPDPLKPWREGMAKKSFNYLLLDPRVTHNIPLNESQDQSKLFKRFISSIFYIGKGKQTRPHEHLYEAIKMRTRQQSLLKITKKVKRILDIWEDGNGVISIHVFQNSLPVEAFCREAAMIEAIGLSSITNVKRGDFYGICTSWSNSDKRLWGCHLLFKAFHIFLHEGERQIRPVDL